MVFNSSMPNKRHRLTASTLTHRLIKNLTDVATRAQASVTRCLAVHPHQRESLIEAVQPTTETHQGGHEAPERHNPHGTRHGLTASYMEPDGVTGEALGDRGIK